ncbi:MAG: LOG family protein [Elusimicrobiota bacterium]
MNNVKLARILLCVPFFQARLFAQEIAAVHVPVVPAAGLVGTVGVPASIAAFSAARDISMKEAAPIPFGYPVVYDAALKPMVLPASVVPTLGGSAYTVSAQAKPIVFQDVVGRQGALRMVPAVHDSAKSVGISAQGLRQLSADLGKGGANNEDFSGRFFENSAGQAAGTGDIVPAASQSETLVRSSPQILLPRGLKRAFLDHARSPADIDRLLPLDKGSVDLVSFLKNNIRRLGPVGVVSYMDGIGREFAAIDLQENPALLDILPGLKAKEKALVRRLQSRFDDVQLLVSEEGKTPKLVVDGIFMDVQASGTGLEALLSKADARVGDFASRHMLAGGDLAVETPLPMEEAERLVRRWAAGRKGAALGVIRLFFGDEMRVLRQGLDGVFRPESGAQARRRAVLSQVPDVQLLLKRGRLGRAQEALMAVEKGGVSEEYSPAWQAREQLEAKRMLLLLRKLSVDPVRCRKLWENFKNTHSEETVKVVESAALKLLAAVDAPEAGKIAQDEGLASRIVRQIEEPIRILREAGITATVPVYGSARILSREQARARFDRLISELGRGPWTPEQSKRVSAAKNDLENSRYYEMARRFAALVVRGTNGKVAIVAGGGGGAMEGANRGAFEAGGKSVGFNIHLEKEQALNPYITPGLSFEFEDFAPRKMALRLGALAHVHFIGGFGTFDELFETLTLMQNKKIPYAPIVLVGARSYWRKIIDFNVFVEEGLISPKDMDLFHFVENEVQAWAIVRAAYEKKVPSAGH